MFTLKCRVKTARYDVHAFDERYSSDFTGTVTSNANGGVAPGNHSPRCLVLAPL
jgi:hypothetical protein